MIGETITAKYPKADLSPDGNVKVTDFSGFQGLGVEITKWELPDKQPTIEELLTWAKDNPDKVINQYEVALIELAQFKDKTLTLDEVQKCLQAVIIILLNK